MRHLKNENKFYTKPQLLVPRLKKKNIFELKIHYQSVYLKNVFPNKILTDQSAKSKCSAKLVR